MSELNHIVAKSRHAAAGGFGVLSTGEKLAAALVLNRPDWLARMNYTLAEAIERVGADWLALIPQAARQIAEEAECAAQQAEKRADQAVGQRQRRRPDQQAQQPRDQAPGDDRADEAQRESRGVKRGYAAVCSGSRVRETESEARSATGPPTSLQARLTAATALFVASMRSRASTVMSISKVASLRSWATTPSIPSLDKADSSDEPKSSSPAAP